MTRSPARLLSLALLVLLCGCASLPPGKRDPNDHFERFNRAVFRFNQTLDDQKRQVQVNVNSTVIAHYYTTI